MCGLLEKTRMRKHFINIFENVVAQKCIVHITPEANSAQITPPLSSGLSPLFQLSVTTTNRSTLKKKSHYQWYELVINKEIRHTYRQNLDMLSIVLWDRERVLSAG